MRLLLSIVILVFSSIASANSELIYEAQKKQINLTDKDKETLEIGEISKTAYVVGGILGTYPIGLGIGHAIQGRWSEKGYIFTWGELGSAAVVIGGALSCVSGDEPGEWGCSDLESGIIILGVAGYIGFRIWEIVDVWAAPPSHNDKFRSLKKYINETPATPQVKSSLDLVPVFSPKMGQGLGLKYVF